MIIIKETDRITKHISMKKKEEEMQVISGVKELKLFPRPVPNPEYEDWKKRRVVSNPDILCGEPVFAGTRLSVRLIGGNLRHGLEDDVRDGFDQLTEEDIKFARKFY